MKTTTTLILGCGFGGIAAAKTLRSLLPAEHKIIVIDRSPNFIVGATKTWMMLGLKEMNDLIADRRKLLPGGVDFIEAEIEKIDCGQGYVNTTNGSFQGDHIIIALGADLSMEAIPGLDRSAHSFYSVGETLKLRDRLLEFNKGEIVFLIPQIPFKCPPAPYEAALMLENYFTERQCRDDVTISIFTIEPGPMSTAGPEMSASIRELIESRSINYHPLKQTKLVDGKEQKIIFNDNSEKSFDLLIAVPPHRVPGIISDAGLCDPSGWINVDRETMKVVSDTVKVPVYAVGDNTVVSLPGRYRPDKALSLPKAGVFAASQGIVAAKQIAASVDDTIQPVAFDGKGYCFIEIGNEHAIKGEGSFFAMPHPVMQRRPPDSEQYQDKVKWIENWLKGNVV